MLRSTMMRYVQLFAGIILAVLVWTSSSYSASRTGTATQIDGSAGNGSTSVTVPADATGVAAFWAHFNGNTASTLSSLTLNGVSFTIQSQLAEGATTDEPGVGAATLPNPATGAQTVAWTWTGGARAEGGEIVLVWVKDVNTANLVRATGTDANTAGGNVAATVATETTDLLLAFALSFTGATPVLDGTAFIDDALLNSHRYDVSEVTSSAGSTAVNMTGESYSAMAVVSLRDVSDTGGGGGATIRNLLLMGVGQ